MSYKVKQVADLVGVSVRTLHHYDRIGLLKPHTITENGYRIYSDKDIETLQQILFFKELDFSLNEIKSIINNPKFNRKEALISHRFLLKQKKKRLEGIIDLVEKTIKSIEGDDFMDKKNMFKSFDMSEIEKHKSIYSKETREKYADTDAYKEANKKTSKYTKEDWARITEEGNNIFNKLALMMDRSIEEKEVQEIVEEWRQYITNNFYDCTLEIFQGLSKLYITDERFTANIDKTKKGLAEYLSRAIEYYCNNL